MAIFAPTQRPTIREVAEEAGVSTSTVSLYFQAPDRVAVDTGERIAEAATKLGYTPRRRNGDQPQLFGLLMEELSAPAYPQAVYGGVVRGLELAAKQANYNMLYASVEEDCLPQVIQDGQVRGVVLLGGCLANDKLAATLLRRKFPFVLLDNYIVGLAADSVLADNEWGGYQAFTHLAELGHTQIAIIEGPQKYHTLVDRLFGALRAAQELGIPIPPEYRQPSISSGFPNKGYREMKELLQLKHRPTAVFVVSDRAAFGALEAVKEAGLSVPEDISIVGFDDEVWAEHAKPPLTTVRYPRQEMGALAMARLLQRIEEPSLPPVRTHLYTELIVRSSSAPFRQS
ncbi:LacI family DNA-binding transcriptional regulator [Caldilinea sp.]|uniref:LacI family DNA-binding transcriptional regulator n=1 Tax=Caldilinea sp. TaxID=2293560 RepID=UPI002BD36A54|nr:LacI family DNA-binding transcriptional regulator [Anaerolineales bacterium]HQY94388.1 LacI family DNA-binding transcriptional regulator [Caldilinea sp.]HRA64932.1 LacI family DNA-binding transcriptional regulator [Caldilinea sp.]